MSWAARCLQSLDRAKLELPQLISVIYSLSSVLIAAFAITALVSCILFFRWWRLDSSARVVVWRFYGLFMMMVFLGCLCGAFAWGARMQNLLVYFSLQSATGISQSQRTLSRSRADKWSAAFFVMYSFELSLLVIAKLFVLDRLLQFVSKSFRPNELRRLKIMQWSLMFLVAAGCLVVVVASTVAGVIQAEGAFLFEDMSAAIEANATAVEIKRIETAAADKVLKASEIISVAQWAEVAVLSTAVMSFVAAFILCLRRLAFITRISARLFKFNQTRMPTEVKVASESVKIKIFVTVVVVFFAFVLRTVFAVMFALSAFVWSKEARCSPKPCDGCYTDLKLIYTWNFHAPEFRTAVSIVSSPLTLLVSAWGMTSRKAVELLLGSGKARNSSIATSGAELQSGGDGSHK